METPEQRLVARLSQMSDSDAATWLGAFLSRFQALQYEDGLAFPVSDLSQPELAYVSGLLDDPEARTLGSAATNAQPRVVRATLVSIISDPSLRPELELSLSEAPTGLLVIEGALVAAAIVFMLSLDIEVRAKKVDGKRQWSMRVRKRPTSEGLIGKVLSMLKPGAP